MFNFLSIFSGGTSLIVTGDNLQVIQTPFVVAEISTPNGIQRFKAVRGQLLNNNTNNFNVICIK